MKTREALSKRFPLALRKRREGLVKLLPPAAEILRGSLIERYLTCGNPNGMADIAWIAPRLVSSSAEVSLESGRSLAGMLESTWSYSSGLLFILGGGVLVVIVLRWPR